MYVKLEESDYREIAKLVDENGCLKGSFYYSDLYINVDYDIEREGYRESDTYAWVTTSLSVYIELSFDNDCDVLIDYDSVKLKDIVEDYLKD